jgi:hypothetical protein
LTPFFGTRGTLFVDSARNKAVAQGKMPVPIFGTVDANLLFDFTKGETLTQAPFIGCKSELYGKTFNLADA